MADLLTAMVEGGALEDALDIFAVMICRGCASTNSKSINTFLQWHWVPGVSLCCTQPISCVLTQ